MLTMPAIDMMATGRNITMLRQAAGLTVRDLQTIFGFATPQAIYKWQHGTAMPTIDNLVVLAMIFGVMDRYFYVQKQMRGAMEMKKGAFDEEMVECHFEGTIIPVPKKIFLRSYCMSVLMAESSSDIRMERISTA